ncbi:hypothetical protein ACFX13_046841 [Malus domestica]
MRTNNDKRVVLRQQACRVVQKRRARIGSVQACSNRSDYGLEYRRWDDTRQADVYTNHEASKGFNISNVNDAEDSVACRRFDLLYICNDKASLSSTLAISSNTFFTLTTIIMIIIPRST